MPSRSTSPRPVADIVGAYRLTVGNKRVTCASQERLTVLADKSLTVELIRIITDNAIKYTADDGCVDIRSSRRRTAEWKSSFPTTEWA